MKTRDELWWGQKRRKMLKIMRMLGLRFILQENCACKSTSSPFESEEDFCNELIYQKKGLCLYHLSCQPLLDSRNDKISQLFGWAEDEEESRKQPQKHDPRLLEGAAPQYSRGSRQALECMSKLIIMQAHSKTRKPNSIDPMTTISCSNT